MTKLSDDKKLIESIKKDKKNFEKLFSKFYDQIHYYIRKRISNKSIAEDLACEVFEKAFTSIDDFQWQGVSISSWIYRIARNLLTDHYRKIGRKGEDISLTEIQDLFKDEKISAGSAMAKQEEELALYNALREFKEIDQYLIYYKFFEGLSNIDIAEITGLSESNVGTRLYRIRKKIRKMLKNKELF